MPRIVVFLVGDILHMGSALSFVEEKILFMRPGVAED